MLTVISAMFSIMPPDVHWRKQQICYWKQKLQFKKEIVMEPDMMLKEIGAQPFNAFQKAINY